MSSREVLIEILESSRSKMTAQLTKIEMKRSIYPLWTIREMLAHLSGWDAAAIEFIRSLMADQIPATPAARGIDVYNAESVAARDGLTYDQVYREYIDAREVLITLLQKIPDVKISAQYILPWGTQGSIVDIVNIYGPHEEEHADDVANIIAQSQYLG
ncbi:MAG: ClbS/DfsB family four-helix bundle protein [Chloroflexi bacterium]|nr:ClbS/DfsB family four-helix bundle protein [Chloroflexota bacterium]